MTHAAVPLPDEASPLVARSAPVGGRRRVYGRLGRLLMLSALLAGLIPAATFSVHAQTADITVTTEIDKDDGSLNSGAGISLREAIAYAPSGAVITLPAGTYALTLSGVGDVTGVRGDLDVSGKTLTLIGAGAETTRIEARFGGDDRRAFDRVLDVHADARLTIADVTIAGGSSVASGGGIRNLGALTANRIVVSNNATARPTGGTVEDDRGGGIYNGPGAQLTLQNSEVRGNSARRLGGGIFVDVGGTATISASTLVGNVAVTEHGGALANFGTVTLVNSTISGNSANGDGGGIYNASGGVLTAVHSTITANTANAFAAAGGDGGGALNASATVGALTFRNSIIGGNRDLPSIDSPAAENIYPDLHAPFANTIVGNRNNLIGSRAGIESSLSIGTIGQSDIVTPEIALTPLEAHGGATRTHLPLPESPAVDAANSAVCVQAPVGDRDQRGLARRIDGNGADLATCDIGAVEIRPAIAVFDGVTPVVHEGSVNVGTTQRGVPLVKTLTIRNPGEAPLVLDPASLTLPEGYTIGEGFAATQVAPGAATTLDLRFMASGLGAASGVLRFQTNAPERAMFSVTVSATATPRPATLAVTLGDEPLPGGAQVSFGAMALNQSVDRNLTLRNVGDQTLTLGAVTAPDGFVVQAGPSDTTLTPGEATNLVVRFLAAEPGVAAGSLSIAIAGSSPYRVGVSAVVATPAASALAVLDLSTLEVIAADAAIDLGATTAGTPLTRTFRLLNSGSETLTIESFSVPPGFRLAEPLSATPLASGDFVDITIEAEAAISGAPSGVLAIATDPVLAEPFSVTVSAVVTAAPAQIAVSSGGAAIVNNRGVVQFEPTTLGSPVERMITLRNAGGSPLTIGAVMVPAGFTLISAPEATLAPNATTSLVLRLDAARVGTFAGMVSFTTNAAATETFRFRLTGSVANRPPQAVITIGATAVGDGTTVDIGTTPGGAPLRVPVTIRNTGGSPLALDAIVLPPGFSRAPGVGPAERIPPGGTTTFDLVLDAAAEGTASGLLTVRTNDPATSEVRFRISGVVGLRTTYLLLIGR